ncbi:PAQR family membrane homeostasis protein TrhA, partial [Anaerotignum lactatifermentans]|uniref:PAQR family membrane homeostasis protein TrhA n=1 Tax=Anaerotignum lactatifermentans TaxID=160404 RepID=UPI001A9ADAA7
MSASSDGSTSRSTTGASHEPEPSHACDADGEPSVAAPVPSGTAPSEEPAPSIDGSVCASCPKRRRCCPQRPRPEHRGRAPKEPPHYTVGEEIANSITHGIGVLLGIAGLVLLIVKAALDGAQPAYLASAIVFGVSIILEYLASTLYHAIQVPGAKRIFRIIDHSCIYLLIAGSYTPFLLITLEPYGGIVMFVVIWALAFAGISFE